MYIIDSILLHEAMQLRYLLKKEKLTETGIESFESESSGFKYQTYDGEKGLMKILADSHCGQTFCTMRTMESLEMYFDQYKRLNNTHYKLED